MTMLPGLADLNVGSRVMAIIAQARMLSRSLPISGAISRNYLTVLVKTIEPMWWTAQLCNRSNRRRRAGIAGA